MGNVITEKIMQGVVPQGEQVYNGKIGQWATSLYDLICFRAVHFEHDDAPTPFLNLSENSAYNKITKYPDLFKDHHESHLTRICKLPLLR